MKKGVMLAVTVAGLVLVIAGLYYLKSSAAQQGVMAAIPYICIGVGCGVFGHGTGELLASRAMKNAPDLQKQVEIEKNDERNIDISNRAKGKAYDAMLYIFGALMVSFGVMDIPPYVILMLVFSYLLVVFISIYYRCKYDKEM